MFYQSQALISVMDSLGAITRNQYKAEFQHSKQQIYFSSIIIFNISVNTEARTNKIWP